MWYLLILLVVGCHGMPSRDTERPVPKYTDKFLIVGDYGSSSRSGAERVAQRMDEWAAEFGADFVLSLGDNFYQDGPPSVSSYLFNERWKDAYNGEHIKDLFWFMSVGNHDYYPYEGYEWNEVLRTWAPGEQRWYLPWLWYNVTLDTPAGPLDLIVADSQAARKNLNDREVMYQWFEDTLKWSEENNRMKIAVSHHPGHSAGNYYPGSSTIRNKFETVLEQYNAEFMLCGHDHNMQHIQYKDGSGPEILIIGGGGAGLYGQDPAAKDGLDADGFRIGHFSMTYGFAGCLIDENGITIHMYDDNGNLLHSVSRPARKR